VIAATIGLSLTEEQERNGLDVSEHGESVQLIRCRLKKTGALRRPFFYVSREAGARGLGNGSVA